MLISEQPDCEPQLPAAGQRAHQAYFEHISNGKAWRNSRLPDALDTESSETDARLPLVQTDLAGPKELGKHGEAWLATRRAKSAGKLARHATDGWLALRTVEVSE